MRVMTASLVFLCMVASLARALEPAQVAEFQTDLSEALLSLGMTPDDFRIRYDYAEPDTFRLALVDSLMRHPASLLNCMDSLAQELEKPPWIGGKVRRIWDAMGIRPVGDVWCDVPPVDIRDTKGHLRHLSPQIQAEMRRYLEVLAVMAELRRWVVGRVKGSTDFLYDNLPRLVSPSQSYEGLGPFELHGLEKEEEALTDSVLKVCRDIDMVSVSWMTNHALGAAGCLAEAIPPLVPSEDGLKHFNGASMRWDGGQSTVTGGVIYAGLTPWGPVVIGGSSCNTYEGCFALIVDLGGDDTYRLEQRSQAPFRTIIDYGGDDYYWSKDICGVAGAIMGTSIIHDLAGDDIYTSKGISLGAGICGAGILIDEAGNDTYTSEAFSQGAGFLGLGILYDISGNDTYTAGMQSQAFGYVMGCGLLLDEAGNDTYYTRMAQIDILRYEDHYLTLSQGCAFGARPDYSGGIGLLIDLKGNDLYSSDIFGQGVAYWFAVGALIDRAGHDRYCSYQYAQGAGIHLALGLLLDEGGDDAYQSKGVSQGCGHDLSLGLLCDISGNDGYSATDLSQGAGSANGTGILYDADGTDSYAGKSSLNVNGYGDYRREFGSIGLQLDRRGRDFYAARGEDDSLWESGKYGLGIDLPEDARKPMGDLVVRDYPFEARQFSPEELFILSSRGEPRFRAWREYAFDRMVEDSLASIRYLRTVLDTKDARERHTIKDILVKIGLPAVPMLMEATLEDNPKAQGEASWVLGLIGSSQAFQPLMELSRAEDWRLRSSALNSLGKLKDLPEDGRWQMALRIRAILADSQEVIYVKKDAAFAAGRQRLAEVLPELTGALAHHHYAVRFAAAEALREMSQDFPEAVYRELDRHLAVAPDLDVIAALHAGQDLPVTMKLGLAHAVTQLACSREVPVGVALAGLLNTIEPEGKDQIARLEQLKAGLPDAWQVRAVLRGP